MEKDSINFLPWREAHRERLKKKLSNRVMVSLFIFVALQYAIYMKYRTELNLQSQQIAQLDLNKQTLQQEIKRRQQQRDQQQYLSDNIKQLIKLHQNQGAASFLLSSLASIVPAGVVFQKLEKRDEEVSLTGISQSAQQVSWLMDELEKNIYFINPKVTLISRSATEMEQHNFILSFSMRLFSDSRDGVMPVTKVRGKTE